LLRWTTLEELFYDLLTIHADTHFATGFKKPISKNISPSTAKKYIAEVRKYNIEGSEIYKKTSVAKGYRKIFGDDMWDYKTETSKMHYFSSGTWFRDSLKGIDDPAAKEVLVEWMSIEDQWQLHRQNDYT
jgi:hypothetical protein